ncbi:oxidoreductase [Actinobacteria bacterium YIM 96077]|uniref:Oxidoreductase n=1 Tax=Phytoactinopolyspora halophila TaxID=1981511 RepID=A0A329R4Z8_9ACTN|nr:molybdopterin-dependent oxidoreductase [Phytoactinopolyspora halophila]AYY12163.1 oxidoreductase [Actinobacteria bacterium YIM 96077]RAW18602.1 oxidoreductase [Phytoactinopolyspora halophila]
MTISSRISTNWRPALAGVLALGLGLGTAELVAGVLDRPAGSPVVAAAEWFIDVVPAWLADLAITWFGTADKLALGIGVAVVLALAGAGIGVLARHHRRAALGVAAVLVVVALLVVWSRRETSSLDLAPSLAAGVVALPALAWLAGLVERAAPGGAPGPDTSVSGPDSSGTGRSGNSGPGDAGAFRQQVRAPSRRAFVTGASATAALAALAAGAGRWMSADRIGVESARDDLGVDVDLPAADPPPDAELGISGSEPWRTPNEDFYRIDTAFSAPSIRPEEWRLRIHGMVEQELELGYDDLVGMGLVDRWTTLTCVSNEIGGGLVGNALWTGVPIADVLDRARPLPDADAVLSTSHDGWTCGTPLEALTDERGSLFAVGMNGEPLPVEHGFPVRMVVPGLYGYVSATKWVVDLEVSRFDQFDAYWTTRGWAERGPIKVSSRIDVPEDGARVGAGKVAVAGSAWAQQRGIEAVEVRVDAGPWIPARLGGVPNDDTWRQWVYEWDATAGEHELEVRAVTADGETQTGDEAPPAPDGATGWHRIAVTVE